LRCEKIYFFYIWLMHAWFDKYGKSFLFCNFWLDIFMIYHIILYMTYTLDSHTIWFYTWLWPRLVELPLAPAFVHRSSFFSLIPPLTEPVKLGEGKKLAPPALWEDERKELIWVHASEKLESVRTLSNETYVLLYFHIPNYMVKTLRSTVLPYCYRWFWKWLQVHVTV